MVVVCSDMANKSYEAYTATPEGREQENRLAYVAVTRAKRVLVLARPETQKAYRYPLKGIPHA